MCPREPLGQQTFQPWTSAVNRVLKHDSRPSFDIYDPASWLSWGVVLSALQLLVLQCSPRRTRRLQMGCLLIAHADSAGGGDPRPWGQPSNRGVGALDLRCVSCSIVSFAKTSKFTDRSRLPNLPLTPYFGHRCTPLPLSLIFKLTHCPLEAR